MTGRDNQRHVFLVDPAAHGGHRETDLAMLGLFGLPQLERVLRAYDEAHPLADGWRDRVGLHRLHPLTTDQLWALIHTRTLLATGDPLLPVRRYQILWRRQLARPLAVRRPVPPAGGRVLIGLRPGEVSISEVCAIPDTLTPPAGCV